MLILRKIITPFIIIFIAGFIGIYNFNYFINQLHDKAKEENKNNVWFAKKAIRLYIHVSFTTLLNLFAWLYLFFIMFN